MPRRLRLLAPAAVVVLIIVSAVSIVMARPPSTHLKIQTLPVTTTNILKNLGYVEVTPSSDDPLVPYVAQHFSTHTPVALSVFTVCATVVQSRCDTGYPAFATDQRPVVFLDGEHILALQGTVYHGYDAPTQQSTSLALVSAVPLDWQDLAQLDSDQRQHMLRAMPTIERATRADASEDTVTVPPFNESVKTVWLDLSAMNLPMK